MASFNIFHMIEKGYYDLSKPLTKNFLMGIAKRGYAQGVEDAKQKLRNKLEKIVEDIFETEEDVNHG